MANRRMFSVDVVCTDKFLEMPTSSQALYFQLGMKADDDGFVSAPKQITRMTNASDDDLKLLASKKFIIPFESGVIVISDWKVNNYLRKDRYTETRHVKEKSVLEIVNDVYILQPHIGIPSVNHMVHQCETQDRLGKDRLGKDNKYSVNFDALWKEYPRKIDKASAYKCYQARLKDGYSEEELMQAVKNYSKECEAEKREQKYIKHAKTFLGTSTPFVDYLPKGGGNANNKGESNKTETGTGRPASDYYRKYLT